jgi:tRNA threonylcarbamoyladenosine biosynthesis protein TsaB
MTALLAIETATDACSVALYRQGQYRQFHEVLPRQHNRRLFSMLSELLPRGDLRDTGVDAIAYGCGPGSFTGLRIAASAVQGLAYTSNLPVVAVSTLACQAATALRRGLVDGRRPLLSTLDARVNEIYWALYSWDNGLPRLELGPLAGPPGQLIPGNYEGALDVVGTGGSYLEEFPAELKAQITGVYAELVPEARDLVPLALASLERQDWQMPVDVQPVYVRDEISWKKVAEQGRPR